MTRFLYRLYAPTEQPEGLPEAVLLVAESEVQGRELLRGVVEDSSAWDFDTREGRPATGKVGIVHIQNAPARLPAMTPREVCNLPMVRDASAEVYSILQHHIPEVQWSAWPSDVNQVEAVSIRVVSDPHIDGYRIATMTVVSYEGHPVMITQDAGRGGDDHRARFILDELRYPTLVRVLNWQLSASPALVGMDEPLRELTDFYGGDIRSRSSERKIL